MTLARPWKTKYDSGSLNAGKVAQRGVLWFLLFQVFSEINQIILFSIFFFFACSLNSDATGSFPDYPNEEDGGSALIFAEKDPQQVTYSMIYCIVLK